MKTFTKILTAAAATALLATGCVNEDPAYKNNEPGTPPDPNAKGYLTLADMSMRVVVDTDTETRPDDTSDETAMFFRIVNVEPMLPKSFGSRLSW